MGDRVQSIEVKTFKNELRNYAYYKQRLVSLSELIDFCFDMLPGSVHGIDPGKEPSHSLPDKEREYRVRDEIEHHEKNLRRTREKIEYIDEILAKIERPLRTAIIAIYVEGKRVDATAAEYFLSPMGLSKRINKAIENALK